MKTSTVKWYLAGHWRILFTGLYKQLQLGLKLVLGCPLPGVCCPLSMGSGVTFYDVEMSREVVAQETLSSHCLKGKADMLD